MSMIPYTDLSGDALDWAVAQALGLNPIATSQGYVIPLVNGKSIERPTPGLSIVKCDQLTMQSLGWEFAPSTNPSQSQPLMERWSIGVIASDAGTLDKKWSACVGEFEHYIDEQLPITPMMASGNNVWSTGPTMLVAAMRAFVGAKLGKAVEVPKELA